MCRITVIFSTLKAESLLSNTFASNNRFTYRNIFQNGIDVLSKIDDAFFATKKKKNESFVLFDFSDDDQILLACGINTFYGIIEFQTSNVNIYNGSKKTSIGTSTFYTNFCFSTLSCFHCCC